jgi:hypothetical protein
VPTTARCSSTGDRYREDAPENSAPDRVLKRVKVFWLDIYRHLLLQDNRGLGWELTGVRCLLVGREGDAGPILE